jgi:hypothetical protein
MSEDKVGRIVSKIDREYLSQYPSDRQGPAMLAIGAYQSGDMSLDDFNHLLEKLENLATEAGCDIQEKYFEIVRKHSIELISAMNDSS